MWNPNFSHLSCTFEAGAAVYLNDAALWVWSQSVSTGWTSVCRMLWHLIDTGLSSCVNVIIYQGTDCECEPHTFLYIFTVYMRSLVKLKTWFGGLLPLSKFPLREGVNCWVHYALLLACYDSSFFPVCLVQIIDQYNPGPAVRLPFSFSYLFTLSVVLCRLCARHCDTNTDMFQSLVPFQLSCKYAAVVWIRVHSD